MRDALGGRTLAFLFTRVSHVLVSEMLYSSFAVVLCIWALLSTRALELLGRDGRHMDELA